MKPVYVFVLETLGLQESDPAEYFYLNRTGGVYDIPDVDDTEEFCATMVNSNTLMCQTDVVALIDFSYLFPRTR